MESSEPDSEESLVAGLAAVGEAVEERIHGSCPDLVALLTDAKVAKPSASKPPPSPVQYAGSRGE